MHREGSRLGVTEEQSKENSPGGCEGAGRPTEDADASEGLPPPRTGVPRANHAASTTAGVQRR